MKLIDASMFLKVAHSIKELDDALDPITEELIEMIIEEQPEVEAIPIDWILKWANKNCMYCYDYDYPTEKTDGWFDINNMVKNWGKENGIS